MRYNFSSDFVKVLPPDTSFANAWETICCTLLKCEFREDDTIALKAPDNGIDIWRPTARFAYQCKSNENGYRSSIDITKVLSSCNQAIKARGSFQWKKYFLATNSNITGNAFVKLAEYCKINSVNVEILKADYWSELTEKHLSAVEQYLDYRLLMSEEDVKEAFVKARYYEKYVEQFSQAIRETPTVIKLGNNWSPLVFELPFSPELTVKNLLEVGKCLFNVDMHGKEFHGLRTSARPSISILYNGERQFFDKRLCDVVKDGNHEFTFWIKIVWKDELEETSMYLATLESHGVRGDNPGAQTVLLMEEALQDDIWRSEFVRLPIHSKQK